MNTEVMFSSKTDLWETPQEFFDRLNDEFQFEIDVCALPENAKCNRYYTPEMDGLSMPWGGVFAGATLHMDERLEYGYNGPSLPLKLVQRL